MIDLDITLARKLVSIPSVNPLLGDDPDITGEHRMAEFLGGYLGDRGFDVTRHEISSGRPNVVAAHGPERPRRTVMFEAHLDTQGIHGMTVPPFAGEVTTEGRLVGRGACDMKGAMASALAALDPETLARTADAGIRILFVGAIGEETGNIGANELVELGIGADEAVILEPTDLNIVHAHKGVAWYEVACEGVAAHGSNPGLGVSAIEGAAAWMQAMRTALDASDRRHPTLGAPSMNVGRIRGGTSINIVPERCVLDIDRRMLPGETPEGILAEARVAAETLVGEGRLKRAEVSAIKVGAPFETDVNSRLIRRLTAACGDEQTATRAVGASWYSDAGPFARTCGEVAVFGPGSIRQAHTADEYIEVRELQAATRILRRFLERLAGEDG